MSSFFRTTIEEAQLKLQSGNALFVDIRDYASHCGGHIEPSFHLDQSSIDALITQTPKDRPLVVTAITVIAAKWPQGFSGSGFTEVYNLEDTKPGRTPNIPSHSTYPALFQSPHTCLRRARM